MEVQFDFVTKNGLHVTIDGITHYQFNNEGALKFVGWRSDGSTDWSKLGEKTADWLRRSLLILEIEAGLHD